MALQPKQTPDCRLEPLGPEHAEAMSRWMEDPRLPEALGVRAQPSLQRTKDWISRAESDSSYAAFAIVSGDRHIGNVVLDKIDRQGSSARLSIYVGENRDRGGGVGTASVNLALAHAFEALDLHKVWLTVHADNAPAIAVYSRCGFSIERVLKGEFMIGGERVDGVRMAIERPAPSGL